MSKRTAQRTNGPRVTALVRTSLPKGGMQIDASDEGVELIRRYAERGLSNRAIAAQLGVGVDTLRGMRQRDQRVQDALEQGRGIIETEITNILVERARKGEAWAVCFFLKCRAGWNEKTAQPDGPAVGITINLPPALSMSEYQRQVVDAITVTTPEPQETDE